MPRPSRPSAWEAMRRELARTLWEATQQILAEVAVASVVIAVFAVVGAVINGPVGAFYGGVLGLVAYIVLRYVLLVVIATWGAGSWLAGRLRSR